jgi:dihydroorotate dehydrogenase
MKVFDIGFQLARPLLHRLDAEAAHGLTLATLKALPCGKAPDCPANLAQRLFGLDFPNPIGLAAGFDKNAEVPAQMLGLGFGFVEVGTVTPLPQAGNPRPRLFRLTEDQAVINRMGFNNGGHDAVFARLQNLAKTGIVGINIGANKDSVDRIGDYVQGVIRFGETADYLTVNISSPNTPGLRSLQTSAELSLLLTKLNDARARLSRRPPMFLKIAPDLGEAELADMAALVKGNVDAVIISNTTVTRPHLTSALAREGGGLSGRPLFDLSTRQLARFFCLTKGEMPLIGVGGISDTHRAFEKIRAGASLLQLYSALVYQGPQLVNEITQGLSRLVGSATLSDFTGRDAVALAHHAEAGM